MICRDCHGELVYGAPFNVCTVTEHGRDGRRAWKEYRCRDCGERQARALWCEEDQGPYPRPPMPQVSRRLS